MKNRVACYFLVLVCAVSADCRANSTPEKSRFFQADNKYIQYTGRIDFSNLKFPRFFQPGVYIKAAFQGSYCSFIINDEVLWGKSHNYLQVIVDDTIQYRLQTNKSRDTIDIVKGLSNGKHTITICKNTEAGVGYLEFVGLICSKLLPLPAKPSRKIEFIGNSITCGMESDTSQTPCDKGEWYDQHNAYLSYGAITARQLNAQWHLSAVSGIGLVHSCCDMEVTMPQVFDKLNMRTGEGAWNFRNYQPNVVTICLGQNDGIQDSVKFCSAYVQFIKRLRKYYPKAKIICLTSPMADAKLAASQKNYLTGVVSYVHQQGDANVDKFFFSKQFHNGCGDHPDLRDHRDISKELTAFLRKQLKW